MHECTFANRVTTLTTTTPTFCIFLDAALKLAVTVEASVECLEKFHEQWTQLPVLHGSNDFLVQVLGPAGGAILG